MPQYLLLINNPVEGGPTPEQMQAQFPKWAQYTQDLKDAGLFVAGDPLEGVDVATTVRVRDGETQITDGPFAETKEFLAGYYQIEVPDLDAALQWAARMPNIEYGWVEVRPVWAMAAAIGAAGQQAGASA